MSAGRRLAAAGIAAAVLVLVLLLALLPGPAGALSYDPRELALVSLINDYRQDNGLQPLLVSDRLVDSARKHSSDMASYGFFGHQTEASDYFPVGSKPWDRMRVCGYSANTEGENIAAGYADAETVFERWMNSPTHNSIMLTPSYQVVGVGLVYDPTAYYVYYWTADFGSFVDSTAHPVDALPATTTTTQPPATTTTTLPAPSTTTTTQPSATTTTTQQTTTTTQQTTTTTSPPQTGFSDVPASSPYYLPVMGLAQAGIVSGYHDGRFCPGNLVTRAQIAKMMVLALGMHTTAMDDDGSPTFPDVPYTGASYPYDFVEEAVSLGIIHGYTNGKFGPNDNVTRAQLAIMLSRAGEGKLTEPLPSYVPPFTDLGSSSAEARAAIRVAAYNGLCSGTSDTTFSPYVKATRGQVAEMVHALYLFVH